ncbi:MAG: hypothetical protein Q4D21_02850 [Phascolarctobacterium sp.]|nr:hypothetical protein [Phascolarctobacterium sp.]
MKANKGFFVIQDLIIFLLSSLLLISAAHNLRQAMELQLTLQELSQGMILANATEIGEEIGENNLQAEIINDVQTGSPYKEIRISKQNKMLFNLFIAN